ncbi:MAG TPA: YdeI/OmpD-associated family protein [Thermoleophilaceae bacterium]|nr:YdeI/OmpD-associated family protein [Thermoleophilaceae bacterium]
MKEPIFFDSPEAFYAWLDEHHESEDEVYVGFHKQHTGKRAMSWSEAVDQALCFGWIDSRADRVDEDRYMQRFTPRRPGSNWSKINVEKVARLKEAGLMRPAGLAAFEQRSDDKAGGYSFERDAAGLPPEYEKRLRANRAAAEYFDAKPPWYRRTATRWVTSAKKEETRRRRLAQLIEDSANGLDIKPLRRA